MLQRGGNAVDAAVAAAFASFAAEWTKVPIGAGGIALVRLPGNGEVIVYDFLCAAPNSDVNKSADLQQVVFDDISGRRPVIIGRGSAAIPGAVDGLGTMLSDWGRLPLSVALQPAIRLAMDGASLSPSQVELAKRQAKIFNPTAPFSLVAEAVHGSSNGQVRICQPELGGTLQKLADDGPRCFYEGDMAEAIIADQRENGGLITREDLRDYRTRRLQAFAINYRQHQVIFPPLPSYGSVMTAFSLKLLESINVPALDIGDCHHLRALAETIRLAKIAHGVWETLNGSEDERIARFLTPERLQYYREELAAILQGDATPIEPYHLEPEMGTTQITVIDAEGITVSLSMLAGEMGGYVVPGTGIIMNNLLPKTTIPLTRIVNEFGGQRLPTCVSPLILLKDQNIPMAVGAGGCLMPGVILMQVISNLLDFEMTPAEAIRSPRLLIRDETLHSEEGWRPNTLDRLQKLNYKIQCWGARNPFFGNVSAAGWQAHEMHAAADPRFDGSSALVQE
jgi:gamma-glutamyltranspeptidase / glutathione hydrolase